MKFILATLFLLAVVTLTTRARDEDTVLHQVTDHSEPRLYDVSSFNIPSNRALGLPVNLRVFVPQGEGRYPVLVFLHGFQLSPSSYTQLLTRISASGFIIVAPELTNSLLDFSAVNKVKEGAQVIEWLPRNLAYNFPSELENVIPDLSKLVIAGHSKGGKVAFALALKKESNVSLPFRALVALDPVDGTSRLHMRPRILNFQGADQFQLPYPTLIIGTNLGPQREMLVLPPCAPAKYGHKGFFEETSAPVFDFKPMDYGHMDFLDDRLSIGDGALVAMCRSARRRQPMRDFTAKLVVDFLDGVLFGRVDAFNFATKNPSAASVTIANPQIKGSI